MSFFADAHHFFALCAGVFEQGQFDVEAVVRQFAYAQCEVDFFGVVVADGFVQFDERAAFFGDHQEAAGVFVEAVDEFEIAGFGAGAADLFDDAEAHAAAAVDGGACGFVDDEQCVVFVDDGKFACGYGLGAVFRRPLFFGGAHGRDAEQVAGLDAAVRLAAFFVQAHFAGADNAVDMAFRYAFEDFYQIVVKALSGFVFGDGNQAD
ncbi:hypothetical protein NEISICOT_02515 [Neisseria sicca ATCC 29256]|uniref:Uncharacterized protein n=1 Tax=Neisseria sicca ATCC 29256 TaxID=547045 RepID=C6M7K5_NEISI|nr:hypothetical protein NEISICOT_02515 [Neisseria sicca ATCC 29256]